MSSGYSGENLWGLSIFGIVVGIVWVFYIFPPPFSGIEEKTIYYTYCPDMKHNSYSCPERLGVIKMSYKVFPKEQLVVSKYWGDLKPCKVFDKDNWECQPNGNVQRMLDGKHWESSDLGASSLDENGEKSSLPLLQQISSFVYYKRSVIDFIRNFI